jgi:hypothetical protein
VRNGLVPPGETLKRALPQHSLRRDITVFDLGDKGRLDPCRLGLPDWSSAMTVTMTIPLSSRSRAVSKAFGRLALMTLMMPSGERGLP